MSSSIQTILSSINKYTDLARAARFLVTFGGLPSGYGAEEVETLQLRCENVNLPGKSLQTFDNRTYGPILKFPTQTLFDNIQLDVLCSSNKQTPETGYVERKIFEDWINYINPYQTQSSQNPDVPYHNFRYRDEYIRNFTIKCFDAVNDELSYEIEIVGAYPMALSSIQLSWASQEIAKFSVTLAYERYYRKTDPTLDYVASAEEFTTLAPRPQHPNPNNIPINRETELPIGVGDIVNVP